VDLLTFALGGGVSPSPKRIPTNQSVLFPGSSTHTRNRTPRTAKLQISFCQFSCNERCRWACNATAAIEDRSGPHSGSTGFLLGEPWPNPTPGASSFALWINDPGQIDACVFDIGGQLIRRLRVPKGSASGRMTLHWDGRLAKGDPAPAGVYCVRVTADNEVSSKRLILIR